VAVHTAKDKWDGIGLAELVRRGQELRQHRCWTAVPGASAHHRLCGTAWFGTCTGVCSVPGVDYQWQIVWGRLCRAGL